ncbi:hypothetical protein HDU93_007745 [Gonapodya sp. JEL0774]|nr:hypothetical protein HDU93_007745 [Gonapodya sp. JEL0774]
MPPRAVTAQNLRNSISPNVPQDSPRRASEFQEGNSTDRRISRTSPVPGASPSAIVGRTRRSNGDQSESETGLKISTGDSPSRASRNIDHDETDGDSESAELAPISMPEVDPADAHTNGQPVDADMKHDAKADYAVTVGLPETLQRPPLAANSMVGESASASSLARLLHKPPPISTALLDPIDHDNLSPLSSGPLSSISSLSDEEPAAAVPAQGRRGRAPKRSNSALSTPHSPERVDDVPNIRRSARAAKTALSFGGAATFAEETVPDARSFPSLSGHVGQSEATSDFGSRRNSRRGAARSRDANHSNISDHDRRTPSPGQQSVLEPSSPGFELIITPPRVPSTRHGRAARPMARRGRVVGPRSMRLRQPARARNRSQRKGLEDSSTISSNSDEDSSLEEDEEESEAIEDSSSSLPAARRGAPNEVSPESGPGYGFSHKVSANTDLNNAPVESIGSRNRFRHVVVDKHNSDSDDSVGPNGYAQTVIDEGYPLSAKPLRKSRRRNAARTDGEENVAVEGIFKGRKTSKTDASKDEEPQDSSLTRVQGRNVEESEVVIRRTVVGQSEEPPTKFYGDPEVSPAENNDSTITKGNKEPEGPPVHNTRGYGRGGKSRTEVSSTASVTEPIRETIRILPPDLPDIGRRGGKRVQPRPGPQDIVDEYIGGFPLSLTKIMESSKGESLSLLKDAKALGKRLKELQIRGLDMEIEMIRKDSGPSFEDHRLAYERSYEHRFSSLGARLKEDIALIEREYEANVKAAHRRYKKAKSQIQKSMIEKVVEDLWRVEAENTRLVTAPRRRSHRPRDTSFVRSREQQRFWWTARLHDYDALLDDPMAPGADFRRSRKRRRIMPGLGWSDGEDEPWGFSRRSHSKASRHHETTKAIDLASVPQSPMDVDSTFIATGDPVMVLDKSEDQDFDSDEEDLEDYVSQHPSTGAREKMLHAKLAPRRPISDSRPRHPGQKYYFKHQKSAISKLMRPIYPPLRPTGLRDDVAESDLAVFRSLSIDSSSLPVTIEQSIIPGHLDGSGRRLGFWKISGSYEKDWNKPKPILLPDIKFDLKLEAMDFRSIN